MKDKEAELKSAEQKLHDEFERLRRQNAEEKRQLDDKKRQLVRHSHLFQLRSVYECLKFTVVTTFTMSIHLQVSVPVTPHWKVL